MYPGLMSKLIAAAKPRKGEAPDWLLGFATLLIVVLSRFDWFAQLDLTVADVVLYGSTALGMAASARIAWSRWRAQFEALSEDPATADLSDAETAIRALITTPSLTETEGGE